MKTIIEEVELLIMSKRQTLQYGKQELKGLQSRIQIDEETICKLECELHELKRREIPLSPPNLY